MYKNFKMTFCPPEGTHIVPSIELRIMAIWREIWVREMKELPQITQVLTKYQTEE